MASSDAGNGFDDFALVNGQSEAVRKVRVHKIRPKANAAAASSNSGAQSSNMDRQIAELIPGIADLSVSGQAKESALRSASSLRQSISSREEARRAQLAEMSTIFDMSIKHPLDDQKPDPSKPWAQQLRPAPKRIQLSHYQHEMINYQRMLLRRNIWYYRDRMNIPRGPCPLHTLKDAWVQGIIDENTLVWGQGLYDWLPAKNVKLLLPMVRTPEVRFGAWLKRTFSLKPALNRIREQREFARDPKHQTKQVEWMR